MSGAVPLLHYVHSWRVQGQLYVCLFDIGFGWFFQTDLIQAILTGT
jgi:hypothetical protein